MNEEQALQQALQETASRARLKQDELFQAYRAGLDIVEVDASEAMSGPFNYTHSTAPRRTFALAPSDQKVDRETARISLRDLVDDRAECLLSAHRLALAGRMSEEAQQEAQEERDRLAAEKARKRLGLDDPARLAELAMDGIQHMRLPEEHAELVREAVQNGDTRQRQVLYFLRRYVEGPDGKTLEPAYTLHQWSPDNPRPKRGAFGPGSDSFTVAELVKWTTDKAELTMSYGPDVAAAHGWGEKFQDNQQVQPKEAR